MIDISRDEGRRVIVVDDEALLLMTLTDMLVDLEYEVVGSATRVEPALRLATDVDFDIAVLDVNLAGKRIDPVADVVARRGLPIVFVTGYGAEFPAGDWSGQVLPKPYDANRLRRVLEAAEIKGTTRRG